MKSRMLDHLTSVTTANRVDLHSSTVIEVVYFVAVSNGQQLPHLT